MARRPTRGASSASPAKDLAEFKDILSTLCPEHTFDDPTIDDLYDQISQIIGRWYSEEARVKAAAVAGALKTMRKNLINASRVLGGHDTGFRTGLEIETVSTLAETLAKDPAVRSIKRAKLLMATFRKHAATIAHAALRAVADLEEKKTAPGRPPYDWYDDFTALLLRIAELAAVEPRFGKDSINDIHLGWLFDAASALEPLLPNHMRSLSPGACGKRLERSLERLESRGQNLPNA